MSTYLEMCQTVLRQSGLTGTVVSVVSQTGILRVLVDSVAQADVDIQGMYNNWRFMWAQWAQTLSIGANVGLFNEYDPPADIGEWIREQHATQIDGNDIAIADYADYRPLANSVKTGTPTIMFIMPGGQVRMSPIPTAANVLTAEYQVAPVRMTANADISLIPPKHHRAIECLATARMHGFNEDWENFKFYMSEYKAEMTKLEASQLPGQRERTTFGNTDNAVIAE